MSYKIKYIAQLVEENSEEILAEEVVQTALLHRSKTNHHC